MKARKQVRSGILYQGPSAIDGAPIVLIGVYPTGAQTNAKTGRFVQTFILRTDVSPVDAIRTGADSSICGDCKHRGDGSGFASRSCYVNVGQSPTSVWRAYRRGSYPRLSDAEIRNLGSGRMVRLGAYGDPAAVPASVWQLLVSDAIGHTGYSHQWKRPEFASLASLCMASVDTESERFEAQSAGWRTFRVRLADEPRAPREFVCPASAEGRSVVQCADCRACNGTATGRKGSPTIIAHGAFARRFALNQSRPVE